MYRICKGQSSKLDLSLHQTKNNMRIGFLTVSWAIISDIDIESECIRFLGILRNDIWGAWRVINLRSYRARFSYLPADTDEKTESGTNILNDTKRQCPDFDADVTSNWITIQNWISTFTELLKMPDFNALTVL